MMRVRMPARSRGFTLIEAMIVVLILSILLGVAIPGFREAFATQRVKTAAKTLFTALRQARSEAMRMNGLCDVFIVPQTAGNWAGRLHLVGVTVGSGAPAFDTNANYAACQFDGNGDGDFTDTNIDITYNNPLATFSAQQYVTGAPAAALASIQYNRLGRPTAAMPQVNFCDDGGLTQTRWSVTLGADGLPQYTSGGSC